MQRTSKRWRQDEVELDETLYTEKMTVKELHLACKERQLPYSGSKRRMLDRLIAFKVNLENQMKLSIASKLFDKRERKPTALGQPRLPSLKEQEAYFVIHLPYAPWCQACVATRAKEDKFEQRDEKADLGKNVIQLDFFYTYAGEDVRGDEGPVDKVKERSDQFGACLVMAASETKAVHVVPVPTKGTASFKTVTEEVVRFSRAIRQILRSVQQVRAVMGLSSEVRMTGTNQHASNGQAERAVQNVRRLANCLRSFAETRAKVNIMGNMYVYPWSFRYAAFLLNRFRVLEKVGKTSYELATGHAYRGKLALFGESVMFKKLTKYKANDIFERGVWVGKHSWNDHHVVLTAAGAFEARTIRRLAAEQAFIASDLVIVKGLPWAYSPQGSLMKHAGAAQRYRQPTLEAEASEEELKAVRDAVAAPAPGLRAQPSTPGLAGGAPVTPAVIPTTPRAKRSLETEGTGPEAKRFG